MQRVTVVLARKGGVLHYAHVDKEEDFCYEPKDVWKLLSLVDSRLMPYKDEAEYCKVKYSEWDEYGGTAESMVVEDIGELRSVILDLFRDLDVEVLFASGSEVLDEVDKG